MQYPMKNAFGYNVFHLISKERGISFLVSFGFWVMLITGITFSDILSLGSLWNMLNLLLKLTNVMGF